MNSFLTGAIAGLLCGQIAAIIVLLALLRQRERELARLKHQPHRLRQYSLVLDR